MHSLFIWVTSLLFFLCSLLLKTKKNVEIKQKNNKLKIVPPPGPPKLPLLGHLHLIGSHPHRSLCKLSRTHGPIMLLKFGSVPTVVISSAPVAQELFKLHDLASCSRPHLAATARYSYNFLDLIFSSYGDRWRELRKICIATLFSPKRVLSFQHIREGEVNLLLNSISQSSASSTSVDFNAKSYSLTANILTRIAFGKSFRGSELDNGNFEGVIQRASAALGSFSASDFFPSFGWIIDRLTGVHGRLEKSFAELDAFLEHVVKDRDEFWTASQKEENIVDVLLRMERDGYEFDGVKFTGDCIKALLMDIFLAGVETGANIIIWTMAELVKNSKVMKKLQDEIRSSIKQDHVKESDLEKLQYLKMVVKEVLRLHAPVPLLLPRETMSHFKLNGYDIDPKTHVHVNLWAIGRDPECWTNPQEFFPERFMGSNIDYKGQNFELIPFGAGRRVCPGMNMGIVTVELALANMLLCFDWKLPNGMKEEDVDMEEEFGITVTKKSPLQLLPIPYLNSN
ncbi:cytochrome P450 71B37-like [Benincasa hispida]|uniref:cytochrome P450 71B37-like n=1 Tax=Benincasa hispida TaxID=102211 RepID=UPI001900B2C4|nr:cytochrome P450 71B37-like [Benincasa hispida]